MHRQRNIYQSRTLDLLRNCLSDGQDGGCKQRGQTATIWLKALLMPRLTVCSRHLHWHWINWTLLCGTMESLLRLAWLPIAQHVFQPAFKLPVCTTATAHIFAFEFDLVMDLIAIFNNKQTEVSTGEKTYDMTVYKVWKHAAWSKYAVKSWLHVKHSVGWMLFAWHFFNHHLDTEKRLSTTTMRWLRKPQQKTNLLSVSIHSTILYH